MPALWFTIVSALLVVYAILDGFDLGAGLIHLFLARTENDRRTVLAAAGPFWDGNEVWLLLAGGALYCAFPAVFASRGFYLAAIVLVWLLVLRGIGMEFRGRVTSPRGRQLLDLAFGTASILVALSLGTAVGFVIRSVPPVFGSGPMQWFPLLCGVCGLVCLTLQSAAWIALKSTGELQRRCRRLASAAWWAVLLCYAAVTAASFATQPHLLENLMAHSWICAFAVMALAGLIGTRLCLSVGFDLGVFASSSCVIASLLASAAAGQFPYLLSSTPFSAGGLTIYNAGPSQYGMSISMGWWVPAFVLAAGYNLYVHRISHNKLAARHGMVGVRPASVAS